MVGLLVQYSGQSLDYSGNVIFLTKVKTFEHFVHETLAWNGDGFKIRAESDLHDEWI